jgi:hypothetical protein
MRSFNALAGYPQGRISAINRHLTHRGVCETMRHHIFRPLAFHETVRANRHASSPLSLDPGGCAGLKLLCTRQDSGMEGLGGKLQEESQSLSEFA